MKKRHRFEALLSFFIIGLGQIVKGEGSKGLKWLLTFYFLLPTLIYGAFLINIYLFLIGLAIMVIIYPIFWIYNVYDAYQ